MSNDHRKNSHVDVAPSGGGVSRRQSGGDLSLTFLGQIQGGKVEVIRLNNGKNVHPSLVSSPAASGASRGPSFAKLGLCLCWGHMGHCPLCTPRFLVYNVHTHLFHAHVASPCQPSYTICRWSLKSTPWYYSTASYGIYPKQVSRCRFRALAVQPNCLVRRYWQAQSRSSTLSGVVRGTHNSIHSNIQIFDPCCSYRTATKLSSTANERRVT